MSSTPDLGLVRRLAIIGCGAVARRHLRAVRQLRGQLQLAALVEREAGRARRFLEEMKWRGPSPALYPSLDALIEAQSQGAAAIDIAAITTPSGSHAALATQALAQGRMHLLLEKPMTLDLAEARALSALAERERRVIAMGHIYRYFPFVDRIQAEIASGAVGRVLNAQVIVRWGHDQAYYDAAPWRGSWASDGGVMMNQTIHALDLMCWLLNEPITRISGQIRRLAHAMEAEDLGLATLELAGGGLCHVEGTTNSSPQRPMASFYILCEKRSYLAGIEGGVPRLTIRDERGRRITGRYWRQLLGRILREGPLRSIARLKNPHTAIYMDLLHAIHSGATPRADRQAGVDSVEHILAIYRSAREGGRPVDLPLGDGTLAEMEGFFDEAD